MHILPKLVCRALKLVWHFSTSYAPVYLRGNFAYEQLLRLISGTEPMFCMLDILIDRYYLLCHWMWRPLSILGFRIHCSVYCVLSLLQCHSKLNVNLNSYVSACWPTSASVSRFLTRQSKLILCGLINVKSLANKPYDTGCKTRLYM